MKTYITLIILLYIPTCSLIGMKRHQEIDCFEQPCKKHKPNTCVESLLTLPDDLVTLITLYDISNFNCLMRTCSYIHTILAKSINFENIITCPEKRSSLLSKDFYFYTRLLYRYADENHTLFDTLWNNQSLNDKKIREKFVRIAKLTTKSVITFDTPRHVFSTAFLTSLPSKKQLEIGECIPLPNEFNKALQLNNRKEAHLYLFSPLKEYYWNAHYRYKGSSLAFACLSPTTKTLQFLLEKQISNLYPKHEKNILHELLKMKRNLHKIHLLTEKIELILKYYSKQPYNKQIINQIDNLRFTPLDYLLRTSTISLKKRARIMRILLQYGANPDKIHQAHHEELKELMKLL